MNRSARTILSVLIVIAGLTPSAGAQHSRRTEVPPAAEAPRVSKAPARVTDDGPININTADVKALMTLTGVGQKVAERIVAYREAHGPFKAPEEVRKVAGVGGGVWEKNRTRIVVK